MCNSPRDKEVNMIIETLSHWLKDERITNSKKLQFAPSYTLTWSRRWPRVAGAELSFIAGPAINATSREASPACSALPALT